MVDDAADIEGRPILFREVRRQKGKAQVDQKLPPLGVTINDLIVHEVKDDDDEVYRSFVEDNYGNDVFRVSADQEGNVQATIVSDQPVNTLINPVTDLLSGLDHIPKEQVKFEDIGGRRYALLASTPNGELSVDIQEAEEGLSSINMELASDRLKGMLNRPAIYDFFSTVNSTQNSSVPQEVVQLTFEKVFEERRNRLHLVF